ncbi:MAG: pentapeptide repeat-containing protein [Proteobacteria bacterium]|nr:pentapeptide repeat-containing protein [Pseudomonadota bacterium]MBU1595475.1 pentapeptide repeat-containing protein [Pseudomonadota bacterium]
MTCCKCDKYGWDEPQQTVFRAPRGMQREYCVFHAPSICKEISALKFNELVEGIIIKCSMKENGYMQSCNLSGVVFPNNISLFSQYDMPMYFDGAKFRMDAIFPNVQFKFVASFNNAVFFESAYFECSRFDDFADFSRAKFRKGAFFSKILASSLAVFDEAIFHGGANFGESSFHGNVYFCNAIFRQAGQFNSTTFTGPVNFDNASIDNTLLFSSSKFFAGASFDSLTCQSKALDMSHVSTRTITNIALSKDNFDKFLFQNTDFESKIKPGFKNCTFLENITELFRLAKRDAASEHDQPGVSLWHYQEKSAMLELIRERSPWLWHFHWLNLYRLSSGYGERENRAFICLIILVLIPLGLNALPRPDLNFPYSEIVNSTLSYIPFTKDLPAQSGWLRLGQGVTQFLITIQATIFAFALRNRFRR